MAHPWHHALSSVRKWGGAPEDYLAVHAWFDASKAITADFRHRALRHHAEGIVMAETIFGVTLGLRVLLSLWLGWAAVVALVRAVQADLAEEEPLALRDAVQGFSFVPVASNAIEISGLSLK